MRLLVLFLFITTATFGQNIELFNYVNEYRVANKLAPVNWDSGLANISKSNTAEMVEMEFLVHSNTNTYECVARGTSLVPTPADKVGFTKFLKDYYNMEYVELTDSSDEDDIISTLLLYTVYGWYSSPAHKAIMLTKDVKVGSVNINIGELTFKSNKKVIGGKVIEFSKFVSHYDVKHFATLNLK
jgi:hypothetical protein